MACAVPGSGETNGGAQLGVDEEESDDSVDHRLGRRCRRGGHVHGVAAAIEIDRGCGRTLRGAFHLQALRIAQGARVQRDRLAFLGTCLRKGDPGRTDVGGDETDRGEGGEHAEDAAPTRPSLRLCGRPSGCRGPTRGRGSPHPDGESVARESSRCRRSQCPESSRAPARVSSAGGPRVTRRRA